VSEPKQAVPATTLYCSFCGKTQHEVSKLIAGPAAVFVCDQCVALCMDLVREDGSETEIKVPPPHTPVANSNGFDSWRPRLTALSVHRAGLDGHVCHLVIREDGEERYRFKLSHDLTRHIADLLSSAAAGPAPSDREAAA